jgi:hypothetical protein
MTSLESWPRLESVVMPTAFPHPVIGPLVTVHVGEATAETRSKVTDFRTEPDIEKTNRRVNAWAGATPVLGGPGRPKTPRLPARLWGSLPPTRFENSRTNRRRKGAA